MTTSASNRTVVETFELPAGRPRPEVLDVTDAHVRAGGYPTLLAFDGEHALALIEARKPQAVVLDLRLPRLSGFDLLQRLRGMAHDRPRVLRLSACAREDDVTRAFELEADDYMIKPFSPQELLTRLERLLNRVKS